MLLTPDTLLARSTGFTMAALLNMEYTTLD
jgi:hypothetical protein